MNIEPTAPTPTDRAASDSTPLVPTTVEHITVEHITVEHITVEHITAREIVEFLRDLAELRRDAGADPGARAAFLARKAKLLGRLAADSSSAPGPARPIS